MATITLSLGFDTAEFWSARSGAAITKTATTYEFLNADGYYVRVSGGSFTFTGDDPSGGDYNQIQVYTDATFTTLAADYSTAAPVSFASYFTLKQESALQLNDTASGSTGIDTLNYGFADGMFTTNLIVGPDGSGSISGSAPGVSFDTFFDFEAFVLGAGSDTIATYDSGDNTFDGGTGVDTIYYQSSSATPTTQAISVNLTTGIATGAEVGTDTLLQIENAVGGAGGDTLTGSSGNNILYGGRGNDTLNGGGAGNDTLVGEQGSDTFVWDGQGTDLIQDFGKYFFTATLNGSNEVPTNASTKTGTAALEMNFAKTNVTLLMQTNGLRFVDDGQIPSPPELVTGFHFHNANAGVNGPIVHDLKDDPSTTYNDTFPVEFVQSVWDSSEGLTSTFADRFIANGIYINIHTVAFPGGEIRGQVTLDGTADDKIDVSARNIGDFATVQDIMSGETLTTMSNGVASTLQLLGVDESLLSASQFVLQTANVNETINGFANADYLFGAGGNDVLNGLGGVDRLYGETGNDTLDGGTGADFMFGGSGDDTYTVDVAGDVATDTSGTDLIRSSLISLNLTSVNYTGIENATLLGSLNLNLTGNGGANTLVGNGGNNVLTGGAGIDTMYGGSGDDQFYVDVAGDKALDGAGTDTVLSATVAINLGSANFLNIENATLTGSANLALTGNGVANTLIGNSGNNTIAGGAGADTMYGGLGNDTFYLDNVGDKALDGGGTETAISGNVAMDLATANFLNIENATLTGATALNLLGSSGINTLIGNTATNFIEGRGGADILTGGGAADHFIFRQSLATSGNDRITDFAADDFIRIDATAVASATNLTAAQFVLGTAALDADDRVMYDQATGIVRFDADGNGAGAAVAIFTLDTKPVISHTEFVLI